MPQPDYKKETEKEKMLRRQRFEAFRKMYEGDEGTQILASRLAMYVFNSETVDSHERMAYMAALHNSTIEELGNLGFTPYVKGESPLVRVASKNMLRIAEFIKSLPYEEE